MSRTEKNREAYLKAKASGAYTASKRDATWDRTTGTHVCCGSKHGSFHKVACRVRLADTSDLKLRSAAPLDPMKARVRALKEQGLTSGEVARELDLKLREVNKLWIG